MGIKCCAFTLLLIFQNVLGQIITNGGAYGITRLPINLNMLANLPLRNYPLSPGGCGCQKQIFQVGNPTPDLPLQNTAVANALANILSMYNLKMPINQFPIANNIPIGNIPIGNVPIVNSIANNLAIPNNSPINRLQIGNLPISSNVPIAQNYFGNIPTNNIALPFNSGCNCMRNSNRIVSSMPVNVPLVAKNSLANLPKFNGLPVVKITETVYKIIPYPI